MKKIRIMIGQLPDFNRIVQTPREVEIDQNGNVVDAIAELDKLFEAAHGNRVRSKHPIFLDNKIGCLLQLLWDPRDGNFYSDVGVEINTGPPDWKILAVGANLFQPLTDGTRVILTPDAGC